MLNNNDFVEEYISECIDRGISNSKLICKEAIKEMEEIDIKIREANTLRIRYKNLKQVLKNFNHESVRKNKTNDFTAMLNETGNIKDSAYFDYMIKICDFIDNDSKFYTSRDIINSISGIENSTEIYICIKDLSDKGIIARDESEDRFIIKGPKWAERPLASVANSA